MRQSQKICQRVQIKTQKDLDGYKKREERSIEGVPKLILGKLENNLQQIWIDELKNQHISKLKEFNNTDRAYFCARTIINACCGLANHYGYFIINENMVFFNSQREIFAWINPDIFENHIKIYLPRTQDGEAAMIRSIISYLKLWYKCDYTIFNDVKHLNQLAAKFEQAKSRPTEGFKGKSPQRQFMAARRNSVNLQSGEVASRYRDEGGKPPIHGHQLLMQNKSTKQICRSPTRDQSLNFLSSSISNKHNSQLKFNQMTAQTDRYNQDFEHRTFNSNNNIGNPLTKSIGMNNGSNYFPNRTTSNKHHIVSMINELDNNTTDYVKNKLLLDDEKMRELEGNTKKMKESLDGIGEELNDLFVSNVENEQESMEEKQNIEAQFEALLGFR